MQSRSEHESTVDIAGSHRPPDTGLRFDQSSESEPLPAYRGLEPRELWRHFAALNKIPRPSGQEEQAIAYVRAVAESAGVDCRSDAAGNTVIRVPAHGVDANASPVAVQAHLDMVCECREGHQHDFLTDPIIPRRDGSLIHATDTTLGADNGIGAAAALALLTTRGLRHGPLELLFTVDEERGLRGAQALDPSLLSARTLINLDGDDPTRLTVGSSGLDDIRLTLPLGSERIDSDRYRAWTIGLRGLRGGHSSLNIAEGRPNALKLAGEILRRLIDDASCRLVEFAGGTARNALPREAEMVLVGPREAAVTIERIVTEEAEVLRARWSETEPNLVLSVEPVSVPVAAFAGEDCSALADLIDRLPHGALARLERDGDIVKTSANLARVATTDTAAEFIIALRSFVDADLHHLRSEVEDTASALGADHRLAGGYPAWLADRTDDDLIAVASELYSSLHGSEPVIEVVHAGLECGVLAAKLGGAQAVTFGPLIRDAHSPSEHVDAATVPGMWALLTGLLERLAGASA